jgi:regulator of RNase E activity RraB
MIKYTAQTLHVLESIYKQINYLLRYEKGSFQSGYCIVKDKKIVVVSKFFTVDARIICLMDILSELVIDQNMLDETQKKLYQQIQQHKANAPK